MHLSHLSRVWLLLLFFAAVVDATTKPSVAVLDFESIGSKAFLGRDVVRNAGRCTESMQRHSWQSGQWAGKSAQIRLYD